MYVLTRTSLPLVAFPNTPVGTVSAPQPISIENDGNATLSFPVPSTGQNASLSSYFTRSTSSTCPASKASFSSDGILGPGSTCTEIISYAPTASGAVSGSLIFTDNNLNAAGVTQTAVRRFAGLLRACPVAEEHGATRPDRRPGFASLYDGLFTRLPGEAAGCSRRMEAVSASAKCPTRVAYSDGSHSARQRIRAPQHEFLLGPERLESPRQLDLLRPSADALVSPLRLQPVLLSLPHDAASPTSVQDRPHAPYRFVRPPCFPFQPHDSRSCPAHSFRARSGC